MFEKKAEEGLNKRLGTMGYLNKQNVARPYTDGFKDGYNKANEWHYVKDELPRIIDDYWSNDLIFLTKDCSGNITKHFGNFSFRKDFEEYNIEDRYSLDEVIAWKEIVLPTELSKKWVDNYEDYQNASNDITFSQYPVYKGKEN